MLEKLRSLLPRRLTTRRAYGYLEQAHDHWAAGDRTACVDACRKALALQPSSPLVLDELARALTYKHGYWMNPELRADLVTDGTIDEAIACWQRAFELGWTNHVSSMHLGHALTARGDFAEAARHLARAIDLKTALDDPEHVARYGDRGERRGPDFIIIGATKCGTTSLYEYLRQHPHVLPPIWKEIEYFRFPERGLDWYLSHFPRIPDADERFISGEASSCYLSLAPARARIREAFPDARLIALLRDPVSKTISHAHHNCRVGGERRSAEQAITDELDILETLERPWHDATDYWRTQRGYVWLSLYYDSLKNWVAAFPNEQLLVIPSEDLYERPGDTLARVYEHLGLSNHRLADYEVHLKGDYERKDQALRERLARFFATHNEKLEELLGRRLDWTRPS